MFLRTAIKTSHSSIDVFSASTTEKFPFFGAKRSLKIDKSTPEANLALKVLFIGVFIDCNELLAHQPTMIPVWLISIPLLSFRNARKTFFLRLDTKTIFSDGTIETQNHFYFSLLTRRRKKAQKIFVFKRIDFDFWEILANIRKIKSLWGKGIFMGRYFLMDRFW